MDPNLPVKTNQGFKQILLKKLWYAVVASITSQVVLLFLFLLLVNLDAFHPLQWMVQFFRTFTSFYTWLYMIPFSTIIFAQIIICAKDYVVISKYSSSRFWKFISIFSLHNLVLLILHVVSGGLVVWLYLALAGGEYGEITKECSTGKTCLIEGKLYLILCGLWSGLYYFLNMYASDKKILFPVIYQRKLLQFKSIFLPIIKKSKGNAIWPTLYFMIIYYFLGSNIRDYICEQFEIKYEAETSFFIYFRAWFFVTLYFVKMSLMSLFFELFLTEPVFFPIESMNTDDLILSNAVSVSNIPVIQHLACYDLYLLSFWCPSRRKQLFSLSQPGGHPHNWNGLVQNLLKIVNEYTRELNKSTSIILDPDRNKTPQFNNITSPKVAPMPSCISSPVSPSYENRFRNMRSMSYTEPDPLDIISVSQSHMVTSMLSVKESLIKKISEKSSLYFNTLKSKLGINFLFGELPEANIQHCLGNGQIIIWTSQGLASLVAFAMNEDAYGIAQKDLPVIITSLFDLKMSVEKLNRLASLSRRGSDDFNVKMKVTVNAAVKRSIFNICKSYAPYLKDLNLKKDVLQYLQSVVNSRI